MSVEKPKKCPLASLFTKSACKSYFATFGAGYFSGICGEFVTLAQNKKLDAKGITAPAFRDNCAISGVQQVAKELSKNTIKLLPNGIQFAKNHSFLFGAATGLPMWALTRLFATPVQNQRKGEPQPFKGLGKSIVNDVAYHTFKNGLDQVCIDKVFPAVLPKVGNFWAKKGVEGTIAAIVGSGCYILAWPIKSQLTGQKIGDAAKLAKKMFPKVFVKKVTYGLSRPYFVKMVQ